MKKIEFMALMLVSAGTSYAQKTETIGLPQYEVIYEYTVKTQTYEGEAAEDVHNVLLQMGSTCAKFADYTTFQLDSVTQSGASPEVIEDYQKREYAASPFFEGVFFQNYPNGKLTVQDAISPTNFTYEEKLPLMEWALAEDTLTVCGYLCQKALASYGGRDWTAWFATEIPASYGPWKLSGLPGLVLMAMDADGLHTFKATSIRKGNVPIVFQGNAKAMKISRDKFVKNKNQFFSQKPELNMIEPESLTSMRVINNGNGDRIILFNDVPFRPRTTQYVPLELK